MPSVIVGTAGHIDHGKSALVRALTGKDPDRLPEEKRRGITIDLGFADLDLGDVRVGFVDVPGHERFVKNMLAGAHGIDVVALVIAADEGVMPQTREHFDICKLLHIPAGLVVITKTDLVEDELIQLVRAEAEELIAGSSLEGAPILAVSAKTGAGLDELRELLRRVALEAPARSSALIPSLPVDRAFTMKGFGAVVTGTLVSGEITEGDELEMLPGPVRVRARGLQVHGRSVKTATAGQRTAINLGGVDVSTVQRGMVLTPINSLRDTQILDAHVDVLSSAPRPIRSRTRIRFHIHAAEVLGRVKILNDTGDIAPGGNGFVQIRLESPVVAVSGERFIMRSYSPSQTVAGGQILDPFALKHRGKDLAQTRERLKSIMEGDAATRVSVFVELSATNGQTVSDLRARTAWNKEVLTKAIREAIESGSIIDCEGVFIAAPNINLLSRAAMKEIDSHHVREPLSRGLARETLRDRVFDHAPAEVFRAVLAQLEQQGKLVLEKDVVRSRKHTRELSGRDAELRDRLEQIYEQARLEPPSLDQAFQDAGVANTQKTHGRTILQLLIDNGSVVRVQGDLFFHRKALNMLKNSVQQYGDSHEPGRLIDVAAFKDLTGVSRKYAIPLLEYLDRERITRRQGDSRVILK
jgi:selenocysteine-specific elongation factor